MNESTPPPQAPKDFADEVLVIGGGIAGSFTAHALARRGWRVRVIDRQPVGDDGPASYAQRVAILQPKINDHGDIPGNQLREGFTLARAIVTEQLGDDPRVGWRACGAFHASYDDRSGRRLRRFVDQFGGAGLCRWIEPGQTREELGVALDVGGVVIDTAGALRPAGLCACLLDHPRIRVQGRCEVRVLRRAGECWRAELRSGETIEASPVVVASAMDALRLEPTSHLDLRPVRGQASLIPTAAISSDSPIANLRRVLCFGGYLTPAFDGRHTLGASFLPGDTATDWRDAEHAQCSERFARRLPGLPHPLQTWPDPTGWAGVRVTTPSRLPYAGPVQRDDNTLPGLYASLGHGSHGIASAAISAQHLADTLF